VSRIPNRVEALSLHEHFKKLCYLGKSNVQKRGNAFFKLLMR